MKKKYKKSRVIIDLDDLMGQTFVIWHDKVYHRKWFCWWQLEFAKYLIDNGQLYKAVRID